MDSIQNNVFYQEYIQGLNIPFNEINNAAIKGNLVVSISTTGRESRSNITGHWSFHTHKEIYTGSCLYPHHSKYHAELHSLLTAVHILVSMQSLCNNPRASPSSQLIIISVGQKKILTRALSKSPLGLKDTVQAHYDLIVEIRYLLSQLDISYSPIHTPGQSGHIQPHSQDSLPTTIGRPGSTENTEQLLTNIITLHHNSVTIMEGLDRLVHHAIHKPALQEKLMKDNAWTDEQIASVAWEEYFTALRQLPRSHRISIAKLSHKLWNTNQQNQKFYGTSDKCILCNSQTESIYHIYQCTHPLASTHRDIASAKLISQLEKPHLHHS
jgi:hypothetical protein